MALTFFARCEGTTLDGTHDYTAGDNTWTLTSLAAFNTSGVKIGTNGLYCNTSNDYATVDTASLLTASAGVIAFWMYFDAAVTDTNLFFQAAAANGNIFLQGANTDELVFKYSVNAEYTRTATTTGVNFTTGAWYFIQCGWDTAGGQLRLQVYNASGTLLEEVNPTGLSFSPALNDPSTFWIGTQDSTSKVRVDNIFMGSAWADSFLSSRDITSYTEYGGGQSNAPRARFYEMMRSA